jgi:Ca-activated chloride channel family protein
VTFGAPALLHLLWLVPALVVLVAWAARRRRQDAERLIAARLLDRGLPPLLERRRAWRATLTLLGVALACVAAAQPRWGFTTIERKLRGVEIIVALDVSNSMRAEDVKPSRMERAKREVIDLLELLQSDRVGVVIFAAGAYPRVPLTTDYVALRRILEDTSPSMLRAQGSDLAAAMTESLKLFGEDRGADRAIVVISDGESHSGALDEVGATLKEAGVRVYALGVGTPDGAPIPEAKGGFKLDRSGQMVLSRLDESALSQLAAATGGATIRSVASASDTAQIVGELRASMVRQTEESRRQRVWNERFQWPLAAGLGLMVLAALLGDGRVRAVALALLVVGVAQAGDLDDARSLSAQGRHDEALRSYTELLAEAPDDPAIRWGMAEALYRAGRYEDAARGFQELAARAPERYRADAYYNAGNAQYRAGRLDDAVKSWDQALAARPDHAGAQKNAEQVRQEIAARQAPPPESQDGAPQDGEPQDGEPQDGQPQDGQPQDGQPQDGQPQDGQPQDGEGAPQDQRPQDGGERSPQDGERSQTKPGEAQPEGGENTPNEGEAQGEAQAGQPSDEAPPPGAASGMSPAEAQRLLDAVEEGTPRVFIDGYPKEKDW